MNKREAHFYLEELQRMMTQHRGIFSEEFVCANGMAILALEQAPESDPEQKIGRWLYQEWTEDSGLRRTLQHNLPKCSICGFSTYHAYRYCPSCGSRMEDQPCRE